MSKKISVVRMLTSLFFLCAIFVVTVFVSLPGHNAWWRELQNTAHTFAFGFFAVICLVLLKELRVYPSAPWYRRYQMALVIAISFGAGVELVQSLIGRDAELLDLVRDALGIGAFLGFFAFFSQSNYQHRSIIFFLASSMLIVSMIPLSITTYDFWTRDHQRPKLIDFDSASALRLSSTHDANVKIIKPESNIAQFTKHKVALFELGHAQYPGWSLDEPYPDWSQYETLRITLYAEQAASFNLTIRIHDRNHNNELDDRFNRRLVIQPGFNSFTIPINEIESAPKNRKLDLTLIDNVTLFSVSPDATIRFYLLEMFFE